MTVILDSRSEAPEELANDAGLGALPGHVWGGGGAVGLGCRNAER